jgi:uncharacterized protein YkwD
MRNIWLVLMLCCVVTLTWYVFSIPIPQENVMPVKNIAEISPVHDPSETETDVNNLFVLINNWRVDKGLPPLIWYQYLCPFSYQRLAQLRTNYSHDGFYPMVSTMKYGHYGENLSPGSLANKYALSAWENSLEHRENLEGDYTYTCIARDSKTIIQLFAKY